MTKLHSACSDRSLPNGCLHRFRVRGLGRVRTTHMLLAIYRLNGSPTRCIRTDVSCTLQQQHPENVQFCVQCGHFKQVPLGAVGLPGRMGSDQLRSPYSRPRAVRACLGGCSKNMNGLFIEGYAFRFASWQFSFGGFVSSVLYFTRLLTLVHDSMSLLGWTILFSEVHHVHA
jgi:hypothetical protein